MSGDLGNSYNIDIWGLLIALGMVAVAANGNVFPCHQMSAITSSTVTSWAMRSGML